MIVRLVKGIKHAELDFEGVVSGRPAGAMTHQLLKACSNLNGCVIQRSSHLKH